VSRQIVQSWSSLRAFCSESIYDKYAEMLAEKVRAFKVGPGFDEGV
jgi:succinate-semialdehyde dehydrogenase/glutarate-semialdehyde dehydrogenase